MNSTNINKKHKNPFSGQNTPKKKRKESIYNNNFFNQKNKSINKEKKVISNISKKKITIDFINPQIKSHETQKENKNYSKQKTNPVKKVLLKNDKNSKNPLGNIESLFKTFFEELLKQNNEFLKSYDERNKEFIEALEKEKEERKEILNNFLSELSKKNKNNHNDILKNRI